LSRETFMPLIIEPYFIPAGHHTQARAPQLPLPETAYCAGRQRVRADILGLVPRGNSEEIVGDFTTPACRLPKKYSHKQMSFLVHGSVTLRT